MKAIIKKDLHRYSLKTNIFGLIKASLIPGAVFMYFHRKAQGAKKYSITWVIYYLILRHFSFKYGFQIPIETKIGEGFYIGHCGTIVISPEAVIGKNCNIAHGVTIGRISNGKRKGAPEIGDFVWMGTN